MTLKDYVAIAGAIARARSNFEAGKDPFQLLISELASVLKSDNPRFDRALFMIACKK